MKYPSQSPGNKVFAQLSQVFLTILFTTADGKGGNVRRVTCTWIRESTPLSGRGSHSRVTRQEGILHAAKGLLTLWADRSIRDGIGYSRSCNTPGWVDRRADDVVEWIGRRGRQCQNEKWDCGALGADQQNRGNTSQ